MLTGIESINSAQTPRIILEVTLATHYFVPTILYKQVHMVTIEMHKPRAAHLTIY